MASRLVERYGVPVFIGTYEDEAKSIIRGSARGIEEFNIFEALDYCQDLLGKFGGHKAAGGFSFAASNLSALEQKLSEFAYQYLKPEHLKPLVKIDAQASLPQVGRELYQEIDSLQPWGIGNAFPVFWTPNVIVKQQRKIGKNQDHLKLVLQETDSDTEIKAIAWRWGEYCPLPKKLDIAYKLQENNWQGSSNIELELIGVRLPQESEDGGQQRRPEIQHNSDEVQKARFDYKGKVYACSLWKSLNELRIKNPEGTVLAINKGDRFGLLGTSRDDAKSIDVTQPHYYQLIKTALAALEKN